MNCIDCGSQVELNRLSFRCGKCTESHLASLRVLIASAPPRDSSSDSTQVCTAGGSDSSEEAIEASEARIVWDRGMADENQAQRMAAHRALDLHESGDDAGAFQALYKLVNRTPLAPGPLWTPPVLEGAARICDARADEWRALARSDLTMPVQLCNAHEHEARWLAQVLRGTPVIVQDAPSANPKEGAK